MTQTVLSYRDGDVECKGLLFRPNGSTSPAPGVLLVHDIRGAGPHPKSHIDTLLGMGFIILMADMFGGGVNPDFEAGRRLIGDLVATKQRWRARAQAGLTALGSIPDVDSSRLAAVGYCFGGATVLELALSGARIRVAASMHGGLDDLGLHDAGKISARVLVCTGADDPLISADSVLTFQNALRAAGVEDWQVLTLSKAKHSYTNPQAPESAATGYLERADRRSLSTLVALLSETLDSPRPPM